MTYRVQWMSGVAPKVNLADFPTEHGAEFFAKEKVAAGVLQVVIYEVGDEEMGT